MGETSVPNAKFYDEKLNPDGIINLSTAENSLLSKELCEVWLLF